MIMTRRHNHISILDGIWIIRLYIESDCYSIKIND